MLRQRRNPSRSGAIVPTTVVREVGLQKLLATRICDLSLRPEGPLAECVEQVMGELRARGITFFPQYYLGDEDFWTADRAVSVNVPWYLANPTLWRLVNDHLFEYTREEVLMYLRHEAGHALNYAFELWRRRDWAQTFGDFRRPYRDVYNPNPWSRDYVRYLHRAGMYHYAQKHPDEDWAETFAVWLDPAAPWKRRYRSWQVAFAKLEFVDRVVGIENACKGSPPNVRLGLRAPYTDIKETVAEYFDIGDVVDEDLLEYRRDLLEIFPRRAPRGGTRARSAGTSLIASRTTNAQSAARFIQQHQQVLTDRISRWIGNSDRRVIIRFLRQLQAVCTAEHMVVPESRRTEKLVELTVVATWHVVDGIHRLS
ncbi:MAG: hypothetical protein JWM82_1541 [Myxococcales bacterium]|nr:hypothetical protein [Myxococcales bacterium]